MIPTFLFSSFPFLFLIFSFHISCYLPDVGLCWGYNGNHYKYRGSKTETATWTFLCVSFTKSFSYATRVFLPLKRIWYVRVQVIRAHFSRKRTEERSSLSNYFFARVTNSKLFLPCFQLLLLVFFCFNITPLISLFFSFRNNNSNSFGRK